MSREVELGCESWTSFASSCSSTAVQRTLYLWLCPSTAVETAHCTIVAEQWRGDTALTFPLFWRRSTVSPVFFERYPRSSLHSFVPFPAVPVPNKPPRFCGRKAKWSHTSCRTIRPARILEQKHGLLTHRWERYVYGPVRKHKNSLRTSYLWSLWSPPVWANNDDEEVRWKTHKRLKRTQMIRTRHNRRILGAIPLFKAWFGSSFGTHKRFLQDCQTQQNLRAETWPADTPVICLDLVLEH